MPISEQGKRAVAAFAARRQLHCGRRDHGHFDLGN
jgi:hypothetical protein